MRGGLGAIDVYPELPYLYNKFHYLPGLVIMAAAGQN